MKKIHFVKAGSTDFKELSSRERIFDLQPSDRKFQVGDDIVLMETSSPGSSPEFSGTYAWLTVADILISHPGLNERYSLLIFEEGQKGVGIFIWEGQEELLVEDLSCPKCNGPHYDEGVWAQKPHKTHLCMYCGIEFEGSVKAVSNPRLVSLNLGRWMG